MGFWGKIFLAFFHFHSTHVDRMFTTRVVQHWGLGGTYLDTYNLKQFDHKGSKSSTIKIV